MRCRQGDLAIIVRSAAHTNHGKMVKCLELLEDGTAFKLDKGYIGLKEGPYWRIDRTITLYVRELGGWIVGDLIKDSYLRPIRYHSGQDETLSWASVPKGKTK